MSKKASIITSAIFIILIFVFIMNYTFFLDLVKGISYEPSETMQNIRSSLRLTGDGERIFNATRPLLAERDEFNTTCETHNESVAVLGCYANDYIYIYNVDEPTLAGVRESTSAHEFLHATWSRLSDKEKTQLKPQLEKVYSENTDKLKEALDSYTEAEQLDELYVRVGTQIADLPEELEKHYAKFFSDQDLIVSFYDSYITPFKELNDKINALREDIFKLEDEITSRTSNLNARLINLESNIAEFNRCAQTAGCFVSQWTFDSRRSELVAEQAAVNIENDEINLLINAYNSKVDEYNSNVLRSSELHSMMNSNSTETKIEQ